MAAQVVASRVVLSSTELVSWLVYKKLAGLEVKSANYVEAYISSQ
jgi:hypothetical protein